MAAIAPCLRGVCQTDCAARAQQKQWPAAVCVAEVLVSQPIDAAVIDAGPRDAQVVGPLHDASVVTPSDAGDTPRIPPRGCSCATAPNPGPAPWLAAVLLGVTLLSRQRRRRS